MKFFNGYVYQALCDGWISSFKVFGRNPDGTYDIQWLDGKVQNARKLDLQEWVQAYEVFQKKLKIV